MDSIIVKPAVLEAMISRAVHHSTSMLISTYFNQATIIKYITKAQAAEILDYKTTHSLKKIERNGMKIGGTYHKLQPNDKGLYSYVDVLRLRDLKRKYNAQKA